MKKVLPLLLPAVLLAPGGTRASACVASLPTVIGMSDYVALVRVVDRRDVQDVRVTEYEVTRVFKGTPPARFVTIGRVWGEEPEQADAPKPTGAAILLLMAGDPEVSAPWSTWEELSRLTRGTVVLGSRYELPVVSSRGVAGVVDMEEEEEERFVPLATYLETLAAAVERAAHEPPETADPPPVIDWFPRLR